MTFNESQIVTNLIGQLAGDTDLTAHREAIDGEQCTMALHYVGRRGAADEYRQTLARLVPGAGGHYSWKLTPFGASYVLENIQGCYPDSDYQELQAIIDAERKAYTERAKSSEHGSRLDLWEAVNVELARLNQAEALYGEARPLLDLTLPAAAIALGIVKDRAERAQAIAEAV